MDSLLAFPHVLEASIQDSFGHGIHYASVRKENQFIMLATFRRYLFHLNEESVALALQSYLGGFADDFQVKYLSHNHFRFTVFSKRVGFVVYKLRRFIGRSFDVYFHLWKNGVPHWEREKILWEEEEEEEGFFSGPTSRLNHGEFHLWREMRKFPRNGPHRKLKRRGKQYHAPNRSPPQEKKATISATVVSLQNAPRHSS